MDAAGPRPPSFIPDVSDTPSRPTRATDTPEARIRRAWWIFAASFFILGLIAVLRIATERSRPVDWAVVGLVLVVGFAAIRHRQAVAALEVGRREEAESFARILSSLSRSVSPDAILGAIVDELATRDRSRPHRRRAPPARRTRPRGDAGERPAGRARFDDAACRSPTWRTRSTAAGPGRPRSRGDPGHRRPTPAPVAAGSLRGRFDDVDRATGGRPRRSAAASAATDRRRADPGLAPGASPTGSRCGPARSTG